MLERLLSFLTQFPDGDAPRKRLDADDPHVAAAALMFHVIGADGILQDVEKVRLEELLSKAYGLTGDDLADLVEAGEKADQEAIDLYAFTSVLKRHLDTEGRMEFIGILWEMVYADGEAHELEDNTVWRVAELIGVERHDRIAARQKAQRKTPHPSSSNADE